jgi:hypothetical protein
LIDHELPRPGSAAGYNPSAHVLPLVLMLAGGGRTLEDLRVLRHDEGLRSLLQLEEMPSSDQRRTNTTNARALVYNLRRALNILGVEAMMAAARG